MMSGELSILLFVSICLCQTQGGTINTEKNAKIVDGIEAQRGQFPYIASLRLSGSHICGGSLIHPQVVLTAAHCIIASASSFSVIVQDYNIRAFDPEEKQRSVARIEKHPNYDDSTHANDIALIVLTEPIKDVKLIEYRFNEDEENAGSTEGDNVIAMGWGALFEGAGSAPSILQTVNLTVSSIAQCKIQYGEVIDERTQVCATGNDPDQDGQPEDTCQGDSGGPLVDNAGKRVVGIVSFGFGCARPGVPGVYARVSGYRDFIDGVLSNLGCDETPSNIPEGCTFDDILCTITCGDGCDVTDGSLGDGICDSDNNIADCAYDAGDCCRATCPDCFLYDCQDPSVASLVEGDCTDRCGLAAQEEGECSCDFACAAAGDCCGDFDATCPSLSTCESDFNSTDALGLDCAFYDSSPVACGFFDSGDFTAAEECCGCDCGNDNRFTDEEGRTCDDYDNDPERCGQFDNDEFDSMSMCCACKECTNDYSVTDIFGYDCNVYSLNPELCGTQDFAPFFISVDACCACNCDVTTATDVDGDGCDAYELNDPECGEYDDDDFVASRDCCNCYRNPSPAVEASCDFEEVVETSTSVGPSQLPGKVYNFIVTEDTAVRVSLCYEFGLFEEYSVGLLEDGILIDVGLPARDSNRCIEILAQLTGGVSYQVVVVSEGLTHGSPTILFQCATPECGETVSAFLDFCTEAGFGEVCFVHDEICCLLSEELSSCALLPSQILASDNECSQREDFSESCLTELPLSPNGIGCNRRFFQVSGVSSEFESSSASPTPTPTPVPIPFIYTGSAVKKATLTTCNPLTLSNTVLVVSQNGREIARNDNEKTNTEIRESVEESFNEILALLGGSFEKQDGEEVGDDEGDIGDGEGDIGDGEGDIGDGEGDIGDDEVEDGDDDIPGGDFLEAFFLFIFNALQSFCSTVERFFTPNVLHTVVIQNSNDFSILNSVLPEFGLDLGNSLQELSEDLPQIADLTFVCPETTTSLLCNDSLPAIELVDNEIHFVTFSDQLGFLGFCGHANTNVTIGDVSNSVLDSGDGTGCTQFLFFARSGVTKIHIDDPNNYIVFSGCFDASRRVEASVTFPVDSISDFIEFLFIDALASRLGKEPSHILVSSVTDVGTKNTNIRVDYFVTLVDGEDPDDLIAVLNNSTEILSVLHSSGFPDLSESDLTVSAKFVDTSKGNNGGGDDDDNKNDVIIGVVVGVGGSMIVAGAAAGYMVRRKRKNERRSEIAVANALEEKGL